MKPPLKRTLRHPGGALKVFWTKPARSYKENFGDVITPLIIRELFGLKCAWSHPKDCFIAGAGSIMENVNAAKGKNQPIIWGSGFIADGDNNVNADEFDIRALRGIESLKRIDGKQRNDIKLGDPGILADRLLKATPKKNCTLGVIPHVVDHESRTISWLKKQSGVTIIDVTDNPEKVVREIASSHFVLSSSLHGLIAADSLEVPNAHLKLSNKVLGGSYKFRDYYSAFNGPPRYHPIDPDKVDNKDVSSITEEISMRYIQPTGIDQLKQDIIKSFPYN